MTALQHVLEQILELAGCLFSTAEPTTYASMNMPSNMCWGMANHFETVLL